ncbi:putative TMIE protein domain-containing protein [Homarus americanus]|uniref:Putative TMIE protein domain-containing protein n=1 Tax=Homarus americanus TaxID=6706 RepID=A0A8J5MT73_HOMAM|nr:putative TMIE protein domain-containing protein [Homarus americanus]
MEVITWREVCAPTSSKMDNSTLCEGVCTEVPRPWEEEEVWGSFRRWHVLLLTSLAGLSVKANYIRRQLARKFRRQLNIINNSEMDEMDLLKALERLRAELRADSGSLAQSEAFSTLSFTPTGTPTYRKGSELHIGVSLEELRLATAEGPITNLKGRVSNIITGALHKLKR